MYTIYLISKSYWRVSHCCATLSWHAETLFRLAPDSLLAHQIHVYEYQIEPSQAKILAWLMARAGSHWIVPAHTGSCRLTSWIEPARVAWLVPTWIGWIGRFMNTKFVDWPLDCSGLARLAFMNDPFYIRISVLLKCNNAVAC